jgi:hypothetical protein
MSARFQEAVLLRLPTGLREAIDRAADAEHSKRTDFIRRALSFPAGKYDDQVDALGLIGQSLDTIMPGNKPEASEKPKFESGYRRFDFGESANDWMTW